MSEETLLNIQIDDLSIIFVSGIQQIQNSNIMGPLCFVPIATHGHDLGVLYNCDDQIQLIACK